MKKLVSHLLVICMMIFMSSNVLVAEANFDNKNSKVIEFIGEDGLEYEYVHYSNPVKYEYDGKTHTLLGSIRKKQSEDAVSTYDYREWKEWSVVYYGITQSFVNMSGPYFVRSVARGESHEYSVEKSVSVSAKAGINIPVGSQATVNRALQGSFSLGATGNYSTRITIRLSGPDSSAFNTRTFYYKTGYHKHNITVIETLRSNWDGVIRETKYNNCTGFEPTYQSYSEGSNV